MNTRGQGGIWRRDDTPDPADSEPHAPGHLTPGILDKYSYDYRRVYVDAVRAVHGAWVSTP